MKLAMNKDTLFYYEDVLLSDVQGLMQATQAPEAVSDDDLKRAINVQLESIKSDVANIQHLLET